MKGQEQVYRGKSIDAWIEIFLKESGYKRGNHAARVLGNTGAAAAPAWIDALKVDARPEPDVGALERIAAAMGETLFPFIFNDNSQSLDFRVARSILHSMPELAVEDLVELFHKTKNLRTKRYCLEVLIKKAPRSTLIKALLSASNYDHPDLQMSVTHGLSQIEAVETYPEIFPVLCRLMKSSSYPVRRAAVCAILARPWKKAQIDRALHLFFKRAPRNIDFSQRSLFFSALETRPQFGPILARWAQSADLEARRTALVLLGCIPKANQKYASLFQSLLNNKSQEWTVYALLALGVMGKDAQPFLPSLLTLLKRPDREIHHFVFGILKILGKTGSGAIPQLMTMAQENDRLQGRKAIYCLGFVGRDNKKVVDFLIQQMRSNVVWRQRISMRTLLVLEAREDRVYKAMGRFLNGEHGITTQRIALDSLRALKVKADFWKAHLKVFNPRDIDARRMFYFCLSEIGADAATFIPELFRCFHRETTDDARALVVSALVAIGSNDPRVSRFLLRLCQKPASPKQRWTQNAAIQGLTVLPKKDRNEALAALCQLAKRAPQLRPKLTNSILALKGRPPWLEASLLQRFQKGRSGALKQLATFKACSVPEALIDLFEHERGELRLRAVEEMITLRGQSATIDKCLTKGLKDPQWKLRVLCIEGLRGRSEVTDVELRLLLERVTDGNWHVRHAAVVTLGTLKRGHGPVRSALIKALSDESQIIRAAAALALSRVCRGAKNVEAPLRQRLKDWDERVRCMSLYALGRVGWTSRESFEAIFGLLQENQSFATRRWALVALSYCPTALLGELYERLEEGFNDHAFDFRTIIQRLGARCLPLLEKKLSAQDLNCRYRAIYFLSALGQLGRPGLVRALDDVEGFVREEAARALARQGPGIEPELLHYLASRSKGAGAFLALKLLCRLERISGKAFPFLLAALQHPSIHGRCIAIEAFGRVDVERRVRLVHLIRLRNDPHWIVRAKARSALERLAKTD